MDSYYVLKRKIIVYVKDEGCNLKIMTTILKSIIFDMLGLEENFQGTCFAHAFSTACQYATIEEKVCKDLQYMLIKFAQRDLQKCITLSKKFGNDRQEWEKACVNSGFPLKNWILQWRQDKIFVFNTFFVHIFFQFLFFITFFSFFSTIIVHNLTFFLLL